MEFNFDEMTIGEYAIIMDCVGDSRNLSKVASLIAIMPRFTNTDILNRPFTEYAEIVKQFSAALADYFNEMNKA